MMKPVCRIFLSLALTAVPLAAQLTAPSPLVSAPVLVPGAWIIAASRGQAALQAGFPDTAAVIFRALLRDATLPAAGKQEVTLALVTALMDAGDLAGAGTVLQGYDGPTDSAYQLRVGLLAINARHLPQAKAALAAGKVEDLPAADKGWWYYLQGLVADAENNTERRYAAFAQANAAAVSEVQRARIALSQELVLLKTGPVDESHLAVLRRQMDSFPGQRTGFDAARYYAAALAGAGRGAEAEAVLQRQLAVVPAAERNVADQMRLMLGLIAGEGSVAGRQAFYQLLRDGQKPETQRLALQLLARGAKTPGERLQLRRDLGGLIAGNPPNPIIEDLMLVRAQTALVDKDYAPAEEDARALLDRFPGTALKAAALGVRLAVAWDGRRYRAAADIIAQLRATIAESRERSELGVLLAEAWFRAGADADARGADGKGEFRNAADAYAAALHELPAVVPAGVLIFQQVLSNIRADQLEVAAKQLDEAATNPGFDAVSRWQAEWNLVKEMQVRGEAAAAYARVNRLLSAGTQGVTEELRIRLLWLRAKLSFDNGKMDATLLQADELLGSLQTAGGLDAKLRTNVTSMVRLLKAQALLALNRDKEGIAVLEQLRSDFRATAAAQYSYLIQAGYLTQRGDIAAAQGVLVSFVDNPDYRNSEYAPLALYEAALNLERQGLDRHLRDAYDKMLERLIHDYPQSDLVFYARLKQGDLLRRLNEISAARLIYEYLVNNYSGHPDVLLAELALADTFFAQGANNVVNYESAMTIYERLRDLESAPVDLRAEAGFKWAYAWSKRGQPAKAQPIFWSVVDTFLLNPAKSAQLGAKGRYWVSRSLLEWAQIQEDAGLFDEAQRAYQLIVNYKLYGVAQARAKLARFQPGPALKP